MTPPRLAKWLEPDGLDQIEGWAASGLTNKEIAQMMGVSAQSFYDYRRSSDLFDIALKCGRSSFAPQPESEPKPERKPTSPHGPTPREWTLAETRFVQRFAGLVPVSKLALDLGRDVIDVADECARVGADPRYSGHVLHWCPSCSSWRPEIMLNGSFAGLCRVCAGRVQLERIEGRIAALLPRLPPDEVENYAVREAERGSYQDPPPSPPDYRGMDERAEIAARTAYEAERSIWEARQIKRRVKAAQKRKERIAQKVTEYERRKESA